MNKVKMMTPWIYLAVLVVYLAWINCARPVWLSDSGNDFLKGFVNHELLAVLGFIFAITVAAAGSLHIEFKMLVAENFPALEKL